MVEGNIIAANRRVVRAMVWEDRLWVPVETPDDPEAVYVLHWLMAPPPAGYRAAGRIVVRAVSGALQVEMITEQNPEREGAGL